MINQNKLFSLKKKKKKKKKKKWKKKTKKKNVFPSDDERTVGTFYAREIENWYATWQT